MLPMRHDDLGKSRGFIGRYILASDWSILVGRDQNTDPWLVHTGHVTWIQVSDWFIPDGGRRWLAGSAWFSLTQTPATCWASSCSTSPSPSWSSSTACGQTPSASSQTASTCSLTAQVRYWPLIGQMTRILASYWSILMARLSFM